MTRTPDTLSIRLQVVHRLSRIVAVPLLAYHVLLLAGAFILLTGLARGDELWIGVGGGLIVAGIGIELAVLWWSASLVRRTTGSNESGPLSVRESNPVGRPRLCASCGWKGKARGPLCPRCQKMTIMI